MVVSLNRKGVLALDLFDCIKNRRSIGKVKPDPVENELIKKVLESATWAPNHHKTEPWKFFVLTGEGRRPLGRVLAEISKENMVDPTTEENQKKLLQQMEKPFRSPVIIVVAVTPSEAPGVLKIEEMGAVSAAIQNMLLTAHALGLGAIWRTGKPTYHPKMKELFHLAEKDEVLGFVYMGYPNISPAPPPRTPFQAKTSWIDSDQSYP